VTQNPYALTGASIFDGEKFRRAAAVIIEGRFISDIVDRESLPAGLLVRQLEGGILASGFIDIQVNGGGGALLNAEPTLEGVRRIAEAHRRFGTTGLLPTVITDAPEVISHAIGAVREARRLGMAGVLGIHIEGPFIDPVRKGAHEPRFIRRITEDDIVGLSSAECGVVMVTVAPNCVPPEMIAKLAAAGIIVSLGHSDARAEEAEAALRAGARTFTHLFNAMSQMEGRAPGMVGAALAHRESYCSIIADGHHVKETALRAVLAAKPKDRVVLITDAMSSAAGGPDRFHLQGREVRRKKGRLMLEDGTLAGSDLTMDEAIRFCVNKVKVPLEKALLMASANPATLIGRGKELGRIAAGYVASLVHLSEDLQVQNSWIEGREATGEPAPLSHN
jgi:N-acetylglucosamine-6-phosphate deacetylase